MDDGARADEELRTDWNFSEEEKEQCFCLTQFNVKSCSVQGIFKTADVEKNDPSSLACPLGRINVFSKFPVSFFPFHLGVGSVLGIPLVFFIQCRSLFSSFNDRTHKLMLPKSNRLSSTQYQRKN